MGGREEGWQDELGKRGGNGNITSGGCGTWGISWCGWSVYDNSCAGPGSPGATASSGEGEFGKGFDEMDQSTEETRGVRGVYVCVCAISGLTWERAGQAARV